MDSRPRRWIELERAWRDLSARTLWVVLIVSLGVGAFVGAKLVRMARIRGWVGDRIEETHVVTGKRIDRHVCWVAWDGAKPRGWEDRAVQLPRDRCGEVEPGDEIEIVRLDADSEAYLVDGIYASNGNLVFDFVLVGLAGATALIFGFAFVRRRRSGSQAPS